MGGYRARLIVRAVRTEAGLAQSRKREHAAALALLSFFLVSSRLDVTEAGQAKLGAVAVDLLVGDVPP